MHAQRRFVSLLILASVALVLFVFFVRGPDGFALRTVEQIEYDGAKHSASVIRIGPGEIRLVADVTEREPKSVQGEKTLGNSERRNEHIGRMGSTINYEAPADSAFKKASQSGTSDTATTNKASPERSPSEPLYDPTNMRPLYDSTKGTTYLHMHNGQSVENSGDVFANASVNHVDTTCTPRKNLVFLKTHKTGSSTIQNIVYRYGDSNGLTFALPRSGVYMGVPSLFQNTFPIKSPTGRYNMLANHARYNRPEMAKVMYDNAAYVTIIRHPSTQFDSMYTFYGFKGAFKVDLAGFADNPLQYYRRQGSTPLHSALNPTLYDLGMAKSELSNVGAVNNKIAALEREFDLILVAEYLLESLVLLKDLMCWDFSDVTYFSANARTKSKVNEMSERTFSQLYKWNHGDALLYEHFNRTLWRKVEAYGREKMSREVRTLEKKNRELAEKCVGGTKEVKSVSTLVSRYVLKESMKENPECVKMIRPAIQYLEKLKKKQKENHLR